MGRASKINIRIHKPDDETLTELFDNAHLFGIKYYIEVQCKAPAEERLQLWEGVKQKIIKRAGESAIGTR